MNLLEWNDKLAAHFFRPEMAGRQVFLFVTEDILNEIAAGSGETWQHFVWVLKGTHPWQVGNDYLNICQRAVDCAAKGRWRERRYPPYIAYLGLFVLAAGRAGDFATHAYYPRLRELLGEGGHGMLPGFDRMGELWDALEQWANFEKGGDLGLFNSRSAGAWQHVGMPLSQTILTASERRALLAIFASAQLDPTSSPSDQELCRVLRAHGGKHLRPRTMTLLRDGSEDEAGFLGVLLATAREDLEHWDGHLEGDESQAARRVFGNLRLCAVLERVAQTARFTIRCSMNREFPEAGLSLNRPGSAERFSCQGELLNWSTPLQHAGSRARADGAVFDWAAGVDLREESLGWRFRLQGSPVRLFRDGQSEGVRGFVEVNQPFPEHPFVLAARSDTWERLEAWGSAACDKFERVPVRQGMPAGWGLYRAASARSDEGVRADFPRLAFPSSARLVARGGISAGRRNAYFRFGAPSLVLEGARAGERVFCCGVELVPEEGVYQLPASLPAGAPLAFEIRRGQDVLRQQPLSLLDDFDWRGVAPRQRFDAFGSPLDAPQTTRASVAGAALAGSLLSVASFSPPPACFSGRRVFFIGPAPGQIVSWPSEALPKTWSPVWAVPMARRGRAIFCGTRGNGPPGGVGPGSPYSRREVRRWKQVLHYWRRRVAPPAEGAALLDLWRQYQEAARHVRP